MEANTAGEAQNDQVIASLEKAIEQLKRSDRTSVQRQLADEVDDILRRYRAEAPPAEK